jgi:hypothetical protein
MKQIVAIRVVILLVLTAGHRLAGSGAEVNRLAIFQAGYAVENISKNNKAYMHRVADLAWLDRPLIVPIQ